MGTESDESDPLCASMTAAGAVSAVIPVFNGAAFLGEAIRSVLDQTRPVLECIVIDDGSTDATPNVVEDFGDRVVYVRQRRAGVSSARNRGAERARGALVAFLDHDDAWLAGKLERQVPVLEDQRATLALCAVEVVDERGVLQQTQRLRARTDLLTGMVMFDGTETVSCSSAGLFRRDQFLRAGGFDPRLSMSADWDLLFRTLLDGPVAYVDEPLVRYRVHGANMSRDIRAMERDMTYSFEKAFADPRLPDALRRRRRSAYGRLYRMLAGSYEHAGHRRAAIRTLSRALRHDPGIAVDLLRRGHTRSATSS
jgi:glycosyltransferase involved in cell wall biosynthesis